MYFDFTDYDNVTSPPQELVDFCQSNFHHLPPFGPIQIEFCQALSNFFSKETDPDITALGFWLRAAHIQELKADFTAVTKRGTLRTSRGLAFHITASNIDTLFVYSWMLSLLAGNGNVIRVPTKQSAAIDRILCITLGVLKQPKFAAIADSTCLLRYGHQPIITELLSTYSDIRIIWGSNESINTIRKIPLSPYSKEVVFPDRFSYTLIATDSYLRCDPTEKQLVAQAFFRDAYGYDQHGCSSPRVLFWIGTPDQSKQAASEFTDYLQAECIRRGYRLPLSDYLKKLTVIYTLCSQLPIEEVQMISNEVSTVTLSDLPQSFRNHPGGGLFYHLLLNNIQELQRFVSKQDQTATHFGFDIPSILETASTLNGLGPSRFVPIGEALLFSNTWDGTDILQDLTRSIEIRTTSGSIP